MMLHAVLCHLKKTILTVLVLRRKQIEAQLYSELGKIYGATHKQNIHFRETDALNPTADKQTHSRHLELRKRRLSGTSLE